MMRNPTEEEKELIEKLETPNITEEEKKNLKEIKRD